MTMNCDRAREELVAYLDGELGGGAAADVQRHLDRCPACKLEAEKLSATGGLLDIISDIEPSAEFTAGTVQRAMKAPEQAPAPRLLSVRRLLPAAAAAAVILTVTLWVLLSPGPQNIENLPPAEQEIVKNMEILENLELLEDMELLDNLDLLLAYDEEDFETPSETPGSSEDAPQKKKS
jgi:anti-sigma factor RsiW